MKKFNILAAKNICALAVALVLLSPAQAGIPVIDGANLSQSIISAVENVAHTLNQIQQFRTQLQQYENQLKNTRSSATNLWDQARSTMSQLRGAIDTLNYYKTQLGSLDSYISKFKDVSYYKNSACFIASGCSASERAMMAENRALAVDSQKKANDALFKGLDRQQDAMQADAATLEQLQSSAQGAEGQMAAIGYANQLASHQANQLLQIRALLIAQQNAIGTKMQADTDREAQQEAASNAVRRGAYRPSSGRNW